jgi:hypothetical protein
MIDKNVPIPPPTPPEEANRKYPWDEMEDGDSKFFPAEDARERHRIASAAYYYASQYENIQMTTRSLVEDGVKGIRVWLEETDG